jgi:hypothetical protein
MLKILITMSHGNGCVGTEEFMAEDFSGEDIVGDMVIFVGLDLWQQPESGPSFQLAVELRTQ